MLGFELLVFCMKERKFVPKLLLRRIELPLNGLSFFFYLVFLTRQRFYDMQLSSLSCLLSLLFIRCYQSLNGILCSLSVRNQGRLNLSDVCLSFLKCISNARFEFSHIVLTKLCNFFLYFCLLILIIRSFTT